MSVRNAHGMFVTGLEFLPTSLDGPAVTCPYEAAVVSISVDNRVCIHQVPFRRKFTCLPTNFKFFDFTVTLVLSTVSDSMPVWLVLVLMVLLLCASFSVCSYLGL